MISLHESEAGESRDLWATCYILLSLSPTDSADSDSLATAHQAMEVQIFYL